MPSAALRKVPVSSIRQDNAIAVLSPRFRDAWTGFKSIDQAILFKAQEGLGDAWRIRDKRAEAPGSTTDHERPRALRDAMLVIASMISDHVNTDALPPCAQVVPSVSHRREIAMFASTLLREISISSDHDFGRWRPVRGKRHILDHAFSSCWLEDEAGNILDMTPADSVAAPIGWHDADGRKACQYEGAGLLGDGYGSRLGGIWRGEEAFFARTAEASLMGQRYDLLVTHIEQFLSCSRLPMRETEPCA